MNRPARIMLLSGSIALLLVAIGIHHNAAELMAPVALESSWAHDAAFPDSPRCGGSSQGELP